ncbi:MAG: hypothetical protein QOG05_5997, partial [Streptosporangiaceae bacterium]|nr:hypothetical protein [Streptosporangiaceae bacterium]
GSLRRDDMDGGAGLSIIGNPASHSVLS